MLTIVILALMGAVPSIVAEASSTTSRVRSTDNALAGLIDQATRRSETFRRLLATIQASNGIVYVEPGKCGHGVRACLMMWMQVSGPNRFVRIVINRSKTVRDVEVMGSLGHELQHAIEVLGEPGVTNGVTMFNFLQRMAPTDSSRFETTAAVNAGEAVIYELRTRRAAGRADADGVPAQSRQVPAPRGVIQPLPIQAALDLLKWSPDRVPTIEVVEVRPPRWSEGSACVYYVCSPRLLCGSCGSRESIFRGISQLSVHFKP
jgi:hypothetical protein